MRFEVLKNVGDMIGIVFETVQASTPFSFALYHALKVLSW